MINLRKAKKYLKRLKQIDKRYRKDADSDKLLNCVEKCSNFLCPYCPHDIYLNTQRKRVYKLINRLIGYKYWSIIDIEYTIYKRKEERRNKKLYRYGNKSLPKSK